MMMGAVLEVAVESDMATFPPGAANRCFQPRLQ